MSINEGIQVECIETCLVCGSKGVLLYPEMRDKLFGAAGIWSHLRCPVDGHVWLNPRPTIEDIVKVYATYYTHQTNKTEPTLQKKLFMLYRFVVQLTPLIAQRSKHTEMYLGDLPPGRLLEVGCGAGTFLELMKRKGWQVEGLDIDPKAAQAAWKNYGISVREGRMEDTDYDEAFFDAVTLRHVIEHVHDPVTLLRRCMRVLKPGGSLVVLTPNVNSYGHYRFGANWRGLEPPRHLHIFNENAIRVCARKAGFLKIETWTTPVNAASIYLGSQEIKKGGKNEMELKNQSFGRFFRTAEFVFMERLLSQWRPWIGEEIVLKAIK